MLKRVWVLLLPLVLAACASGDPLETETTEEPEIEASGDIVIGTANFPEAEIIGQIWAAALSDAGFDVDVASGIGSREVYMTALEDGDVTVVPEYAGNLAAFYDDLPEGADEQTIRDTLTSSLPETIEVGEFSPASSADAYRVTAETAADNDIQTIADLDKLDQITVAAPPEFAERRYGPPGLTSVYGIDPSKIRVKPISDAGGPLTVQALVEGAAETANIFTTSPAITGKGDRPDLVILEDPLNLIPPQNVVPVIRAGQLPPEALDVLNNVNASLTTDDLVEMNLRNVGDERAEPAVIARDWVDGLEL
ncbi:ABC transporter substrate-binding protein [Corynebacterium sp. CCUG 69979]|uniref:ABC transporter substrate-binding protein n=1 Tax=Corynebacterium sp. CCUG 69979 TaxID=2823890 RepID=UPI002108DA29|nr:ABC transporter substrate-binding protein [Corynebacterium sp. CCUG 69979]MCQ4625697.1 ABC transporter substrate-binding protein [Corynebacterium sp. CCUG 69979]